MQRIFVLFPQHGALLFCRTCVFQVMEVFPYLISKLHMASQSGSSSTKRQRVLDLRKGFGRLSFSP